MKKLTIILLSFVVLTAFATVGTWKNDKNHSQLSFTVTHLGISDVSGTFNDFEVTVTSAKPDFGDAVFELTADVSSINTRVEARDNHLKSADFFDAAKYPVMTFKSTSLTKNGKDKYRLTGDLNLHGITRKVTMDLSFRGTIEDAVTKVKTAGFQLTGSISRSDFNIGAAFPPPMISDKVSIKADGEFLKN